MNTSVNDIPAGFKSTLPPRKRAKTKEEKEQRRIERILRNRRAAHQSREKKRLHLQHLEKKASLLEQILAQAGVEKLVESDEKLKHMFQEYQTLATEPVGCESPAGELASGHYSDAQKTPESMDASSSHANRTPVSNSAASSPRSSVFESPLSQPRVKRESVGDILFDSSIVQPTGIPEPVAYDVEFDNSGPDVSNWNLLLTNDNEYLTHSANDDEPPIFDMTDNSWGLDQTRNPAEIRRPLRA